MKKHEQLLMNQIVETELYLLQAESYAMKYVGRLRTCKATVFETEHYYVLKSYLDVVAFIDKTTDTCYDILRLVYGYTATSAQHISKFRKDYGQDTWGTHDSYTWRAV